MEKKDTPLYLRWWFWFFGLLLVWILLGLFVTDECDIYKDRLISLCEYSNEITELLDIDEKLLAEYWNETEPFIFYNLSYIDCYK